MTDRKWTQAPWSIDEANDIFGGVSNQLLAITTGEDYGSYFGDDTDDVNAMNKANAHLISAAPDLYEALVEIIDARGYSNSKADAALSKARGITPPKPE